MRAGLVKQEMTANQTNQGIDCPSGGEWLTGGNGPNGGPKLGVEKFNG